jgi:hypothetical protein
VLVMRVVHTASNQSCTPSVKEFQACLSSTRSLSQSRPFCGTVKRESIRWKIKKTNIT